MSCSAWNLLGEKQQLILAPKLFRDGIFSADQMLELAAERFCRLVVEYDSEGDINAQSVRENVLTAQNFIASIDAQKNSAIWRQIAELKGFRRSYLELTVKDRGEFLGVLGESDFVINREPFWTIHRFDSAREITDYSHQPSLHFANDRADEEGYGPNYFFAHWDKTSCWFRKSNWPIRRLPAAKQIEQLYAAAHHRFGCACPHRVCEHLKRISA